MLIRFFKNNSIFHYFLILCIAFFLWYPKFQETIFYEEINKGILYAFIEGLFNVSPLFANIFSFIFLFFQGLLINVICQNYKFLPKYNVLPAFIYIVLMSINPDLCILNPYLFSNFFIIIALFFILKQYDKEKPYMKILNIGLMFSISALFLQTTIIYIIPMIISFMILGYKRWRYWIIIFIAYLIPLLFIFTYYFVYDKIPELLEYYKQFIRFDYSFISSSLTQINIWQVLIYIHLVLTFILSLVFVIRYRKGKQVAQMKLYSIILWFILFSFTGLLMPALNKIHLISIFYPMLAIVFSVKFVFSKNKIFNEIILSVLLLLMAGFKLQMQLLYLQN